MSGEIAGSNRQHVARERLIAALEDYRLAYPGEEAVTTDFLIFVADHADCFDRVSLARHITGSAWIVNATGDAVLLTHHRKLNRWLQPGGHADGDADVLAVALRESREETGLDDLRPVMDTIFDLDIHRIPPRKDAPEHDHYDVRYALRHVGDGSYLVSEESHDLAWVPIARLGDYTDDESMHRMARKWRFR